MVNAAKISSDEANAAKLRKPWADNFRFRFLYRSAENLIDRMKAFKKIDLDNDFYGGPLLIFAKEDDLDTKVFRDIVDNVRWAREELDFSVKADQDGPVIGVRMTCVGEKLSLVGSSWKK